MKQIINGQKPTRKLSSHRMGEEYLDVVIDKLTKYFSICYSHGAITSGHPKNMFGAYSEVYMRPNITSSINITPDPDIRNIADNSFVFFEHRIHYVKQEAFPLADLYSPDVIELTLDGKFIGVYAPADNNLFCSDWTHDERCIQIFCWLWPKVIEILNLTPLENTDTSNIIQIPNGVLIGADPEFELVKNGEIIEASDLIYDTDERSKPIGLDGSGDQVEIRPEPGSPRKVIKSIRKLIKEFSDGYKNYDLTDSGDIYPLGGHIHIGIGEKYHPPSSLVTLLDDFIGRPTTNLSGEARENYGELGDVRAQPHGFEYRTPPASIFGNPLIAYCALEVTRNLCNKFFNEETFEYDLDSEHDDIPYVQDYMKYGGLTERQANYFVDCLNNYTPAGSIRASWKLPPATAEEENYDTSSNANVTVEFRDRWSPSARHEMSTIIDLIRTSCIVPYNKELHIVFYGLNRNRGNNACSINAEPFLVAIDNPPYPVWCGNYEDSDRTLYIGLPQCRRVDCSISGTLRRFIQDCMMNIISEDVRCV